MTINLKQAAFVMPIDDVFEVDELILGIDCGVFITGHIETGIIKPKALVNIVDEAGNTHFSCTVRDIILQSSMLKANKKMLDSAAEGDAVGLIFDDAELLDYAENGMYVVVE